MTSGFRSRSFQINQICRLLINSSKDGLEREIKNVELLKLRFGEGALHDCEIMLRDIDDSNRLNSKIICLNRFSTTIISQVFWPSLSSDVIALHKRAQHFLDIYDGAYHKLKMPRKLDWRASLGSVILELEFSSGRTRFVLSPVHATLILHFQDSESQSLCDLSAKLRLSESSVKRKMMFWMNCGVIVEYSPGTYRVLSNIDTSNFSLAFMLDDDDFGSRPLLPYGTHGLYSKYVIAILANCGGLHYLCIHKILNLLLIHCDMKCCPSTGELSKVLDQLRCQKRIKYADSKYSIRT